MPIILDGTNGGFFPSWTTATRPASPAVGQMGYNTTTGLFDMYTASGWVSSLTGASQSIPKSALPTGSVLQVVQGSYTGAVSTSSTSFVTTNLTASITPSSSSSKILIMVSGGDCYSQTTNKVMRTTIYRNNSTNLATGGANPCFGNGYNSAGGVTTVHTYSFLDSPATTSSTSYTVYMSAETGAVSNYNQNGTTSYIQLMEIAA